jgi:small ligand-binding sensory domain FIST
MSDVSEAAFRAGYAAGGDWQAAFAAALADAWPLPAGANLGFVYATDYYAPHFGEIVERLRAETGIQRWSGTVGLGIATPDGELFDRPALAILAGRFPEDSFRLFGPVSQAAELSEIAPDWLAGQLGTVALLQADPRTPELEMLIADLSEAAKAFPLGGLTASRAGPASAIGGRAAGLSGVLFGGAVPIVSGLSQGCAPLGPALSITAAEGNLISAIEGRSATDVLIEVVDQHFGGRLSEAWGSVHPAFPVPGRDRDDYLVRNFLGLDADKGLVAVSDLVEPGQKILFCRRDQQGARQDLDRMLADVKRRAAGQARAGLFFSVARGPNLFGPGGAELRQIREALGDIPLVGFYAGGEISGDRLYGYTGVLALFV